MLDSSMSRLSCLLLISSALLVVALASMLRTRLSPKANDYSLSEPDSVGQIAPLEERQVEPRQQPIAASSSKKTSLKVFTKRPSLQLSLGISPSKRLVRPYRLYIPNLQPVAMGFMDSLVDVEGSPSDFFGISSAGKCNQTDCSNITSDSVLIGGLLVNRKSVVTSSSNIKMGFWERLKPLVFISIW